MFVIRQTNKQAGPPSGPLQHPVREGILPPKKKLPPDAVSSPRAAPSVGMIPTRQLQRAVPQGLPTAAVAAVGQSLGFNKVRNPKIIPSSACLHSLPPPLPPGC